MFVVFEQTAANRLDQVYDNYGTEVELWEAAKSFSDNTYYVLEYEFKSNGLVFNGPHTLIVNRVVNYKNKETL